MGCHGNHAFSHSKNKCFRTNFSQIGCRMNKMAHMRNCPEGCMVDPGVFLTSIYLYFH